VAAARLAIHVPFIWLMALFEAEGGAKAQGPGQRPAKLELNLAIRSSDEKEANHGNEEEKEEEDGEAGSRKVTTQARAEFASRLSCGS
jgi:hypothetical protein